MAKGWVANKDCVIELGDGVTVVKSSGGDPNITLALPKSLVPGEYVAEIKIASSAKGAAQFFWKVAGKPMHRDRSAVFQPVADGTTGMMIGAVTITTIGGTITTTTIVRITTAIATIMAAILTVNLRYLILPKQPLKSFPKPQPQLHQP